MSIRSMGAVMVLAVSALCAAPLAWAQEATVQQVYQAAEAGKLVEAQAMMDKIVQAHPNSGKAHFVRAELLARQGKYAEAKQELANAERLAPGLPFAKPQAVQKLKALLARTQRPATVAKAPSVTAVPLAPIAPAMPAPPRGGSDIPWTMLIVVGGLVLVAVVYFRGRARNRAVQQGYPQAAGMGGPGMGGMPGTGQGYPQYGGNPGYGPGPAAPGMGSGIMGGLATGAAVGAGAVAGGALMHHLLDGGRGSPGQSGAQQLAPGADPLATPDPLLSPEPPANYDMGGDDFGLSDPGGWDDGGGGGGGGNDEWT